MRDLGPEGEAAWQSLRQHAVWAEGVWFGWAFAAAPADVRELIDRLDTLPSARGPSLVIPLDSAQGVMDRLFAPESAGRRAVWVVAQDVDPRPWESLHLLLNERRERIRRHLGGALLFAGRPEWKPRTREAAPDLWSQRLVVLEWAPESQGGVRRQLHGLRPKAHSFTVERALVDRGLVRARARADRSAEAVALTRLSAVRLREGAPRDAHEEAAKALAFSPPGEIRARALAAMAEAERALGDSATAAGHWEAALAEGGSGDEAAGCGIELGRVLFACDRLAEAARAFEGASRESESQRTRSVALTDLGTVRARLGDAKAARMALAAAVEIDRGLVESDPTSADPRIDLSLSLVGLGDLDQDAGDLQAARNSYLEAVALVRTIRLEQGETMLRALHVALNRLGEVERGLGNIDAARSAFIEAMALARQLTARHPSEAQLLRDLTVSLAKVGDSEGLHGTPVAAEEAFSEAVQIARGVLATREGEASTRRDLLVSLGGLGQAQRAAGANAEARASFAESLALARQLHARRGDLPEPLSDLAIALGRLHTVAPSPDLLAEARATVAELVRRWPTPHHQGIADWIASLT